MWDKALEVAEKHDRIHLRSTHFQMGRHFEMLGDYRAAVREFELAGCSKAEVPRMMFTAGKLEELERYITQSGTISFHYSLFIPTSFHACSYMQKYPGKRSYDEQVFLQPILKGDQGP